MKNTKNNSILTKLKDKKEYLIIIIIIILLSLYSIYYDINKIYRTKLNTDINKIEKVKKNKHAKINKDIIKKSAPEKNKIYKITIKSDTKIIKKKIIPRKKKVRTKLPSSMIEMVDEKGKTLLEKK